MFRRVHIKLTFFCSIITIGILFAMTGIYLSISEHTLSESATQAFGHDMDVLLSNLAERSLEISNLYLQTLEQSNHYDIYIWDNGVPFLYNSLHADDTSAARMEGAMAEYGRVYEKDFLLDDSQYSPLNDDHHEDFLFENEGHAYNVSRICLYQNNPSSAGKSLIILLLSSRDSLQQQIYRQRLRFFLLSLTAGAMLALFAWFFTGRLLRPVWESHLQQTRFVSAASHELRTPLAVIRASIDTKAPGYEQIIQEECTRMGKLVEDMLSLSTLENHTLQHVSLLHKEPLEPDTLLLNLYEQMLPIAEEKHISLQIQLPEEALPVCYADQARLQQVLSVLVQNALSYTPENGRILLHVAAVHGQTHFVVTDNGIGISDKDKSHIFERFYRGDEARSAKNHFGLGLCIAKEIMDAHHGSISVMDTPGGGSTFTVMLP